MTVHSLKETGYFGRLFLGKGGVKREAGAGGTIPWTNAGAPTNGTNGTHAGYAEPGDLLVDTTNKTLYQNSNTKASPTWTQFTTASGSGAFTGTFDGNVGSVTPGTGVFTAVDGPVGGNTPAAGAFTTGSFSGIVKLASVAATVSGAGTTRADATALTKQINKLTTVAASTGVILPASAVGNVIIVDNAGANPVKVYAAGSDTIDGTAGSTGVTLTNAKRAMFLCIAANTYISMQLGVVSA